MKQHSGAFLSPFDAAATDLFWLGDDAGSYEEAPVDEETWLALERCGIVDRWQELASYGIFGAFEEAWFRPASFGAMLARGREASGLKGKARTQFEVVLELIQRAAARATIVVYVG